MDRGGHRVYGGRTPDLRMTTTRPRIRRFAGLALALSLVSATAHAQPVQLGIDVLRAQGFGPLQGKRVGLVTNQTSVDSRGTPTRVILRRDPRVRLTALYTPEHGIDGRTPAGKYVASRKDGVTGLTAYSLYGPNRKPTPAMLAPIDVLVFDLQDIGSRSYTYISTMVRCMEACAENRKEFIVLDRPNPLGGLRVNGPPIEGRWISFVGQLPVPYVHGMTAGELARMAAGRRWLSASPRFSVVPMQGWRRDMMWGETGLRWVPTSPNIPNSSSPFYYAATGVYGSMAGVDIGIGSAAPFASARARGADAGRFAAWMQSRPGMEGVWFRPSASGEWRGVSIGIHPRAAADLVGINVFLMHYANRLASPSLVSRTTGDKRDIWFKCYGSDSIARLLEKNVPPEKVVASWRPFQRRFDAARQPYLLYP